MVLIQEIQLFSTENAASVNAMGGAHMSHHGVDDKTYWEIEDRTSIALTLNDQPGILQQALNVFTKNGINLTRIQSRPPKMIDHERTIDFFADFDGKIDDLNVD